VSVIMLALIYAGSCTTSIRRAISRRSTRRLHLSGEFTEANPDAGVRRRQVTSRIVATQFTFLPRARPAGDRRVTLRFRHPTVIHGVLVTGTNVNTMIVPASSLRSIPSSRRPRPPMPCHEYCGLVHSECRRRFAFVAAVDSSQDARGQRP